MATIFKMKMINGVGFGDVHANSGISWSLSLNGINLFSSARNVERADDFVLASRVNQSNDPELHILHIKNNLLNYTKWTYDSKYHVTYTGEEQRNLFDFSSKNILSTYIDNNVVYILCQELQEIILFSISIQDDEKNITVQNVFTSIIPEKHSVVKNSSFMIKPIDNKLFLLRVTNNSKGTFNERHVGKDNQYYMHVLDNQIGVTISVPEAPEVPVDPWLPQYGTLDISKINFFTYIDKYKVYRDQERLYVNIIINNLSFEYDFDYVSRGYQPYLTNKIDIVQEGYFNNELKFNTDKKLLSSETYSNHEFNILKAYQQNWESDWKKSYTPNVYTTEDLLNDVAEHKVALDINGQYKDLPESQKKQKEIELKAKVEKDINSNKDTDWFREWVNVTHEALKMQREAQPRYIEIAPYANRDGEKVVKLTSGLINLLKQVLDEIDRIEKEKQGGGTGSESGGESGGGSDGGGRDHPDIPAGDRSPPERPVPERPAPDYPDYPDPPDPPDPM